MCECYGGGGREENPNIGSFCGFTHEKYQSTFLNHVKLQLLCSHFVSMTVFCLFLFVVVTFKAERSSLCDVLPVALIHPPYLSSFGYTVILTPCFYFGVYYN